MESTFKILLVEDETSVVNFIHKGLSEENFHVSVALSGITAKQMIEESEYQLFILDIMLPGINGIELCQYIRERGIQSPVLFLTALGTSENIAHGLNIGADDYLVKPFKFIELKARVNALLRRSGQLEKSKDAEEVYTLNDLALNHTRKTVTRGGDPISLTATEYRLLYALFKGKGMVLSRMQLLEEAWDIQFNLGTNVVDVYINYLRKKIDSGHDQKLIHTVIGMGYVLKDK